MPRRTSAYCETEIKLLITELPGLVDKLKKMGAKLRGRVLERNTLFDTDTSDFRQRACLLRLRAEAPAPSAFAPAGHARTLLTAKSPVPPELRHSGRYKINFEREVLVHEPAPPAPPAQRKLRDRGWTFALGCLGLRASFRYEKYRTTFSLKGLRVTLDETPIGVFLELEGAPEAIDRVARELGFTPRDYIRATYYEIYAAERRRRGRPVRNMLFSS